MISIDFRLVPDQTPQAVRAKFETFLKSKGWTIVADEPDPATRLAQPRIVRLKWGSGYPAFRSGMSTPIAQAVIATASKAAQNPVAVLPMMGASVPIHVFADIFKVPVIGLPIVNHDTNMRPMKIRGSRICGTASRTYATMMASLNW